jgi:adenosylcobyric acid synthase
MIEARTGKRVLGVLPYNEQVQVDQEDSLGIGPKGQAGGNTQVDVVAIRLPRMSNFTDLDSLAALPGVQVRFVSDRASLGAADMIVLPGTKQTIHDLRWLKDAGLAEAIVQAAEGGTMVVGICGGYQMLGGTIADPEHAESDADAVAGLGLLDMMTVFRPEKTTHQVTGVTSQENRLFTPGEAIAGYEIHMGESALCAGARCAFEIRSRSGRLAQVRDGCVSTALNVLGTYIHGIFDNDVVRLGLVNRVRKAKGLPELGGAAALSTAQAKERRYSDLARLVASTIDLKTVYDAMNLKAGARCTSR